MNNTMLTLHRDAEEIMARRADRSFPTRMQFERIDLAARRELLHDCLGTGAKVLTKRKQLGGKRCIRSVRPLGCHPFLLTLTATKLDLDAGSNARLAWPSRDRSWAFDFVRGLSPIDILSDMAKVFSSNEIRIPSAIRSRSTERSR